MDAITDREDMALNGYLDLSEIPEDRLAEVIAQKEGEAVEVFIPSAAVSLDYHVKHETSEGEPISISTPGKYVKPGAGFTAVLGQILAPTINDETGGVKFRFHPISHGSVATEIICSFDLSLLRTGGLGIDFDAAAVYTYNSRQS